MSEWQPIETAPKNAVILGDNPAWKGAPMIIEWDGVYLNWFEYDHGTGITPQPTHWVPLPARVVSASAATPTGG